MDNSNTKAETRLDSFSAESSSTIFDILRWALLIPSSILSVFIVKFFNRAMVWWTSNLSGEISRAEYWTNTIILYIMTGAAIIFTAYHVAPQGKKTVIKVFAAAILLIHGLFLVLGLMHGDYSRAINNILIIVGSIGAAILMCNEEYT